MGIRQINPNFARQIIEKYTLAAPFRREEVDFVYYDPAAEKRPPVISRTQLNLRLLFQFQILYQAGQKNVLNFSMLQQALSHSQTGERRPLRLASQGGLRGREIEKKGKMPLLP